MKRQIPPIVFYSIVVVVLLGGLSLLTKPGDPELHQGALIDQPAPPIEGKTLDGNKVSLADYKGKLVLINFWATWCGPCKQEIPTLVSLKKKYGPQGLEILGIISNDELKEATDYARGHEMTWPQLLGTAELGNVYGVKGIPANFIVSREGKVVAAIEGLIEPDRLETEVKAHL